MSKIDNENNSYSNETNFQNLDIENKKIDIISRTRIKILGYCNNMGLSLCDFLDQEIMEDFINYITQ